MSRPTRLLVPTDFSRPSLRAVATATDLAAALGAEIEILHVCNAARALYHLTWTPSGFETEQASAEQDALSRLDRIARDARALGITVVTTVVGRTEPAAAILQAADRADLLVVATRRRQGPGAVETAVTSRARCPVLIVDGASSGLPRGLQILVAVDLSPAAATALREARRIAAALGGTVEALHAVADEVEAASWGGEPTADEEPLYDRRLRRLERFVNDAGGADVPVLFRLAEGTPAEAVAERAFDMHPHLVVAGGRPSHPDALLDAARQAAQCPSLRVPAR